MNDRAVDLPYRSVLELARACGSWAQLKGELLPPRGPRGSRVNRLRQRLTLRALRAWSELGREGL